MSASKAVTVVHPDSMQRILLRSILEGRGLTVMTDHSFRDLLTDRSGVNPGVILIDRRALEEEGLDALSLHRQKWADSEVVILPERLDGVSIAQLLLNIDRLLGMCSTQELRAV